MPQLDQPVIGLNNPQRRRRTWALLGTLLAGALVLIGCSAAGALAGGSTATVVYELIGDAGTATTITYSADGGGGISQEAEGALPWRQEVTFEAGALRVATLSGQNAGSGTLTCRITVDGEVVKEISSSGQYSVVSCASDAF